MRGPLLWAGWLLATGCLVGATGSCRHRCCPGRNNACWAPGTRRALCYCDSYCQRTGDCCQDYLATCRRAGEWPRGWHWPDRGWGHQPGLLCSVASVCCYLLAPYFEWLEDVSGDAGWAGFVAMSHLSPFFHAECRDGPRTMREPAGAASGLQLMVRCHRKPEWSVWDPAGQAPVSPLLLAQAVTGPQGPGNRGLQ